MAKKANALVNSQSGIGWHQATIRKGERSIGADVNGDDVTETSIQREIQLFASKLGCRLFRNNVGMARNNGQVIRYGLCNGSSDLVGLAPDGRFLAVEVKTAKGRVSKAQQSFIDMVNDMGGIGMVARSVEEFAYGLQNRQ
jgi:hypothetical protein